jgi:hypothetical protein
VIGSNHATRAALVAIAVGGRPRGVLVVERHQRRRDVEDIYQYGFWGSIISTLEDPAICGANLPTLGGTEQITDVVHHCPKYQALAGKVPE